MRGRSAGKRKRKSTEAGAGTVPREKAVAPADLTIPVCLGEFGVDEARDLRPLWEATWSQDARSRSGGK
jgi:hypothetical protein